MKKRSFISGAVWARYLVIGVAGLLCLAPSVASGVWYGGYLTVDNGGLTGGGNWILGGYNAYIAWNVEYDDTNNWWDYTYWFGHQQGATSHLILEVSRDFTENDIFNEAGHFGGYTVGDFGPGPGNPEMPCLMHGIKFDEMWGLTSKIEFSTYRVPVWGDFYAKDGTAGDYGLNVAWNTGFTCPDSDPSDPPSDCSIDHHLLVPDTATIVPEPMTLLLLGGGLLGLAGMHRRRRS